MMFNGFRRGPRALIISRILVMSALVMAWVSTDMPMNTITNTITPMANSISAEKPKKALSKYVKAPATADENKILAEEPQSTETPNCFLINIKLMNKPGKTTVKEVTIKPTTP